MAKDKKAKGFDSVPDKTEKKATTVKKKRKGTLADPAAGDQFKMADFVGALVLIDPKESDSIITSASTDKVDVIKGDVTVLTEENGKTVLDEPIEHHDTFIFGRAVVGSLKSLVGTGSLVVATIGRGAKKPGQNAPWILVAATDKQKKIAEAYLDA